MRHPRLRLIETLIQADMPKLRVNAFLHTDGDWHTLIVTITSFDPKDPTQLDPNNKVQECFVSNSCLSIEEALEDMTPAQIKSWMNQPLPTGSWIGE